MMNNQVPPSATSDSAMKFVVQELRPEVLAIALLMEARLREKDEDKGQSWKGLQPMQLMVHASSKAVRLESLVCSDASPSDYVHHAVDLANYCMMIADVAGALETENGGAGWAGLDEVKA